MQWLKSDLELNEGKEIVIISNMPIVNIKNKNEADNKNEDVNLINNHDEIINMLKNKNVLAFFSTKNKKENFFTYENINFYNLAIDSISNEKSENSHYYEISIVNNKISCFGEKIK